MNDPLRCPLATMNENLLTTLLIMQGVAWLVIFLMMFVLMSRIKTMSYLLSRRLPSDEDKIVQARAAERRESTSEFDQFLSEYPQYSTVAKKEQAAAFRDWRKARGKTWQT